MSLVNNDSNAEKFVLDFFSKADDILAKKTGGKKRKIKRGKTSKSFKKQKAGAEEGELLLPVPLNDRNVEDILRLRAVQQSPERKNLTLNLLPSAQAQPQDLNSIFSQHIKLVLSNIGTKTALDMTPEELQVLSLFINFQSLNPQINAAASITSESLNNIRQLPTQTLNEDSKSKENEKMISDVLINVSENPDFVESQVVVFQEITQNATQDIEIVSQLYQSGATPEAISSASISAFVNQFGFLSIIFNLISCYKNRLNEFGTNLKTRNPIIFSIMSALYSVASFIIFSIFKLFTFLLNTKIGKLFLIYQFIILYKNNNVFAVFIANTLLTLLKIIDTNLGISSYVMSCIEEIKQSLIDYLPQLLTSASIGGILNSALTSALSSPAVLSQFVTSLSPEISSQILRSALPAISNGLSEALTNAAPAMVQQIASSVGSSATLAITQGTVNLGSSIAAELAPALIEGLTVGVGVSVEQAIISTVPAIIENAVSTAVVEGGRQLIQQQAQTALTNSLTTAATNYGLQAIGYYFGVPTQGLLTGGGGSNKKTKSKKYKKRKNTFKN